MTSALLARKRMVEQQQQTTINWLNPADQTLLETTIAYEQVAVDLTAYFARNEPDPFVREAFNYKEHGPEYGNRRARELYAEIGEVEEEHVTFYESLQDPTETLLQRQVQHQPMEVYNYQHCYAYETDPGSG